MLAQFVLTASKGEPDYYQVRMYELPHNLTNDLTKMSKFQENPWNAWYWWQVTNRPTKTQILTVVLQNCEKSAEDHSMKKKLFHLILWTCQQYFAHDCKNIEKCCVLSDKCCALRAKKHSRKRVAWILIQFKILFSYVGSRSVMT